MGPRQRRQHGASVVGEGLGVPRIIDVASIYGCASNGSVANGGDAGALPWMPSWARCSTWREKQRRGRTRGMTRGPMGLACRSPDERRSSGAGERELGHGLAGPAGSARAGAGVGAKLGHVSWAGSGCWAALAFLIPSPFLIPFLFPISILCYTLGSYACIHVLPTYIHPSGVH